MTAFLTHRTCRCGRTLWAFMDDTGTLLVTMCFTCDLPAGAALDRGGIVGIDGATAPSNDSGASAQNR